MVQRVQVLLIDDVDGAAAEETVRFGLDGRDYEIDLSGENARLLRNVVASWADHGRTVKNAKRRKRTRVGPSNATLRAWAKSNGHTVSDRGQIPVQVRQAYRAAHPDEAQ